VYLTRNVREDRYDITKYRERISRAVRWSDSPR